MSKYVYECSEYTLKFNHHNSLLVYMALECIDSKYSYERYESYMMQYPLMGKIPESRYIELFNIVANK